MAYLVALTWFGVIGVGAMAMCLLATRFVSWDLIPDSAVARVRWWCRHARAVLVGSAVVAVVGAALILWAA
jgi:Zn-dependent alcohol dehydrogenase